MVEKVIVEVFGIKDQPSGGSNCDCSGGSCCCGPSKNMGLLYDELIDFLSGSRLRNRIDVKFIDILRDDMDPYNYVIEAMDRGYGLPFTSINGKLKFYGGISHKKVYGALMRSL
jgi:hypothetical protein